MLHRSLRHRAPMLWLLLPFMGGLITARLLATPLPAAALLAVAAACLVVALAASARPFVWGCLIIATGWATGTAYYDLRRARLRTWDTLPARQSELTVEVERLFAPTPDGKRVSGVGRVIATPRLRADLLGQRLYFSHRTDPSQARPIRGEGLLIRGVLEPLPRSAPSDSFDGFLVNSGLNFRLTRGTLVGRVQEASAYRRFCDGKREQFSTILGHGLEGHPGISAVLRGMVLGEGVELSEEQERLFLQSGTMHLFSISGLHIAAIAIALHTVVAVLRLPRWASCVVTVSALWFYVDVTGTSPSAVRAFVMVALVEGALLLGRPINPVATLALAAWVALVIDPMQLFGASFQMSYGIVAGLLLLGLPLGDALQHRTQPFRWLPPAAWTWRHHAVVWLQRACVGSFAIGLATFLVSSVATLLYFRLFTPGALLGNLVLIPLSSLALWAGFLSLGCGLAGCLWLSGVFNHAAALVLLAMEKGIELFVSLPAAYFEGRFDRPALGYAALAGLLAVMLCGYGTRWRLHHPLWYAPFLWTGAFLALAVTW